MKKIFALISLVVLPLMSMAQITIIEDKPEPVKEHSFPYDSLSNMKEMKGYDDNYGYRHLIGQTIMYCGDPWKYSYDSPNLPVGDYYYIKNVDVYKGSSIKKYCVFSIENTKTHRESSFTSYAFSCNEFWVVLGYYEKLKSMYVGKEYILVHQSGKENDGLFSFDTDTITRRIEDNSVWKCIDVSVKFRTNKRWQYEVNDHRCGVVMVMDNPKYGKHYCFVEDQFGSHFSITNSVYKDSYNGLPLICGKFQDKIAYDRVVAIAAQEKAKRLSILTKKYGSANAKKIINGYVVTGFSKQMCIEAWGAPSSINKTTGSWGTHEQWVYGSGNYLYFEGNKLTAIQN